MILQSEIDQINSHKRVKTLLIILTALAVAVVIYAVIQFGKEEMITPEPAAVVPQQNEVTDPTLEEVRKRLDELSQMPEGETPPPQPSVEEVQKQLEVLSKVPEGSTSAPQPSPEEIMKRLEELRGKQ